MLILIFDTQLFRNPKEFMEYNCKYPGAEAWMAQAKAAKLSA